jgi:trigger factor
MVRVAVERMEHSRVKLEVDVGAEEVERAWQTVVKHVVGRTAIPGFRKGKAPVVLVERHVGRTALREETLDRLLPDAYHRAVEQAQVEPVGSPDVEVLDFEDGRGLRFAVTVDVRPEVRLGTYRGLGIEIPSTEIEPSMVERELEILRDLHAHLDDRAAEAVRPGLLAMVAYRMAPTAGELDQAEESVRLIDVNSPELPPAMKEALIGAKAGDGREFLVSSPVTETEPAREVWMRVRVEAVKEKILPALDDEFARTATSIATLEELTETIKNKLGTAAREEAISRARTSIIDRVVDDSSADLPESMVNRRYVDLQARLIEDLRRFRMDFTEYLRALGVDRERLESDMRERARREVLRDLVLDAVAAAESLVATREEHEAAYQALAKSLGVGLEKARERVPADAMARALGRDKAADFLLRANTSGGPTVEEAEA